MGRPSRFSARLAETICSRIAEGDSVRAICAEADMPAMSTVFRWLAEREGFREQYARAKEVQVERLVEEMLDIADDATRDTVTRTTRGGDEYDGPDVEWIQRSKLRVDTRKWLAAKLLPKKYGDRLNLDHSGEVKGGVLMVPGTADPAAWDKAAAGHGAGQKSGDDG
ncbi:hypothetical protein GGQ74_001150 [Desulfobaculum xiamenense]|uniref:Terminase small subunit protein n=1 Tax=Desulfobaculum xiamenense TaxID=995050 RepID=A0A846QKC6_9BACT|nr:hypothetical protein [Desulfobaculum xiamenense]NJB67510.1 hypothetical protein [Desulfobaculum xiamenense]